MKKICFVTASPVTLRVFMRNHILRLAERYEVTAVADFSAEDLLGDWLPGVRLVSIPIARQINLLADLRALTALLHFFRSERFDVVHSVTPKAGLLAMTAARLAGLTNRIHCFTGQVWATRKAFRRALLKSADKIIVANATQIFTDSESQRDFIVSEGVVVRDAAQVLGGGSISGVNLNRFHPDEQIRARIRSEWGIPSDACLFLFVGRLNRDKGVLDLAQAFAELAQKRDDTWLVVVGPDEAGISNEFEMLCGAAFLHVRRFDFTTVPEYAMAAADVFVLPSYREGFGSVVIEAAACGIPAVVSRIYGLTDAVVENVTGLMHPAGDVAGLRDCLLSLCSNTDLRIKMGEAALFRAQTVFSMQTVTAALVEYYDQLFQSE
jgi:glycosyltransferase involved in cell wall biosynthesis